MSKVINLTQDSTKSHQSLPPPEVRVHSPPTIGGKWTRNGGKDWWERKKKIDKDIINNNIREQQNINTEG